MSDPDEPVVRVTLTQIYDALLSLQKALGDLVGQHTDNTKDIADHEQRIRDLERSRWPLKEITVLVGVLALVASVAAILITR